MSRCYATFFQALWLFALISSLLSARPVQAQCDAADAGCEQSAATSVGELIAGITADLKARRLARPEGNNALEKIEQLKSIAPDHDYAINGRHYVVQIYLSLGRWQLGRNKPAIAARHLASAVALDPDAKGAAELTRQLGQRNAPEPATEVGTAVRPSPPQTLGSSDSAAEKPGSAQDDVSAPVAVADQGEPVTEGVVEPTQVWTRGAVPDYPEMVALPAGSFLMGGDTPAEGPVREVRLKAFSLAKHEVTVAQYRLFAQASGLEMPEISSDSDQLPVTGVAWQDARRYVAWLSAETGKNYRLPTEAEWEYAARAGSESDYHWGETLDNQANCVGCDSVDHTQPMPIGSYPANDFGLFDMHGNVWEWMQDCWQEPYDATVLDGRAVELVSCQQRVLRGGSWYNTAEYARSSYRGREDSGFRDGGVGFRVARDGL